VLDGGFFWFLSLCFLLVCYSVDLFIRYWLLVAGCWKETLLHLKFLIQHL